MGRALGQDGRQVMSYGTRQPTVGRADDIRGSQYARSIRPQEADTDIGQETICEQLTQYNERSCKFGVTKSYISPHQCHVNTNFSVTPDLFLGTQ